MAAKNPRTFGMLPARSMDFRSSYTFAEPWAAYSMPRTAQSVTPHSSIRDVRASDSTANSRDNVPGGGCACRLLRLRAASLTERAAAARIILEMPVLPPASAWFGTSLQYSRTQDRSGRQVRRMCIRTDYGKHGHFGAGRIFAKLTRRRAPPTEYETWMLITENGRS